MVAFTYSKDSTLRDYLDGQATAPPFPPQLTAAAADQALTVGEYFSRGCRLPHQVWEWLNSHGAFDDPLLADFVAAFPPKDLMENVSGLTSPSGFASHGADFWAVLSKLSPQPLDRFKSVLDFGCGCGRLMRMFLGHPGKVSGCDIDAKHIQWVRKGLPYCSALLTQPDVVLPFPDNSFDYIVSISIFTHLSEKSQDLLLKELHRIATPDAVLMLTIHGERALERSLKEAKIWEMIAVDRALFEAARTLFLKGEYGFILQQGHLTTDSFAYGISFAPKSYIRDHWGRLFHIENHASGPIHDWQDVLVLRPKKN